MNYKFDKSSKRGI